MTLQLQGGRRTTGEKGKDTAGCDPLNSFRRNEKALLFERVGNLDDRDLLCSHVGCKANVAMIRGGIQMRVSGRCRSSGYAQHRRDREDHDNDAE
jgi:hypothetical protein